MEHIKSLNAFIILKKNIIFLKNISVTTLNLTGRDESVAALFKKMIRIANIIFMKMTIIYNENIIFLLLY